MFQGLDVHCPFCVRVTKCVLLNVCNSVNFTNWHSVGTHVQNPRLMNQLLVGGIMEMKAVAHNCFARCCEFNLLSKSVNTSELHLKKKKQTMECIQISKTSSVKTESLSLSVVPSCVQIW